jgi:hypothetical protein
MNGAIMTKKILVAVFSTIFLLSIVTTALAVPDYGTYQNVKTYNAVVDGDNATVSDISGEDGDTIELRVPLDLGGTNFARVYIKLKGPVKNGSITIKKITPPPGAPDDSISFFGIDLSGIDESMIDGADIIFNAPSNYNNVQLHRLVNGNWVPLQTTPLGVEGDIAWYKAVSPGFSSFAITGVPGKKSSTSGKLPYTSGMPLYITGALGLLLITSGIAIRLKAR